MATRTLARRVSIGQYPQHLRVRTVEEYVRRKLGVEAGTVHNWICGEVRVNKRAAVIVEAMVQANQATRADRWLTEVFAARQGVTSLPLSPSVILEAQDADLNEDIAEAYYNSTHTKESLIEWRRRLKLQIAESLRLLTAIETELET